MRPSEIRSRVYNELAMGRANPSKTYWHGTTGFLGKKIAKTGVLKTAEGAGQKVWDINDFESREDHVYIGFTIDNAIGYAMDRVGRNKSFRGSKSKMGAVVKVTVENPDKLVFDEDDIAQLMLTYYRQAYHPWVKKELNDDGKLAEEIIKELGDSGKDFLDVMENDEYKWEYDDWEVLNDLTYWAKEHMGKIMGNPVLYKKLSEKFNSAGHPGELPVKAVWLIDLSDEAVKGYGKPIAKTEADLDKVAKRIPVAKGK